MKSAVNCTVEDLFKGHAEAYGLFSAVRRYIESIGPVNISATKTRVSFRGKTRFAWVWLPQMWDEKQKAGSITLTFDLGRQIQRPKASNDAHSHSGRWTRHVIIESESDLNEKVCGWIHEAYLYAQEKRPRPDRKSN